MHFSSQKQLAMYVIEIWYKEVMAFIVMQSCYIGKIEHWLLWSLEVFIS